jgi:hypothetical protein
MRKPTDIPSTGSEKHRGLRLLATRVGAASQPVTRSGGVGAECDWCSPAFSDATLSTVRELR